MSDSIDRGVCSAGCPTPGAHATYAECLRAKSLRPMWLGGTGPSFGDQKRWAAENAELRSLVKAGGSISTAVNKGIGAAWRATGKE